MDFRSIYFDSELSEGAYNAIYVCLGLKPEERITLIAGEECIEIIAALVHEIEKIGSEYRVCLLENHCQRPCIDLPHDILTDLRHSQVSIYAAHAQPGELHARTQLTRAVTAHHIRHGHMVNISKKIMMQGMRADFLKVDKISNYFIDKARRTRVIRAQSRGGTDMVAYFSPRLNWLKTSGIINPRKWGNLPGGEILTSPERLDGIFVVDGVVGDYLCDIYGDLKETPLSITIENSRARKVECDNKELLKDFLSYISSDKNSNRVGEFAIGTNIAVTDIIGNILQDEKIPGIHIAFGDPYWEHTGQSWSSTTHIDCVGRDFDIWMDDEHIMRDGRFLL